jgi:putative sterol carrier protein
LKATNLKDMTSRDFLYSLPSKVPPAAIEGVETVFHFDLEGDHGGQYTIVVADQKVQVSDGLHGEPKCAVRASEEDFVNLATGELNPMMAVLTGKVKISNQAEMLRFAKIFGLM